MGANLILPAGSAAADDHDLPGPLRGNDTTTLSHASLSTVSYLQHKGN